MSLGTWKPCAAILLLLLSGTQFLTVAQSSPAKASSGITVLGEEDLPAAQSGAQGQQRPSLANRELAAQVRKSLVVVLTQDHEGNVIALGSGFFFKPGLVATNLHLLKWASQGYVKSLSDGVSYKISSVVGFDLKHDICILKLSEAGGAPLPLSTDAVAVGDDILVAGNPEGLEASFSKGIVSGIRSGSGLIQIDAAISLGSSGGPVVNQQGEVIGLAVSSLAEGQNLNFAVPVRYLREQKLVWNLAVRTVGGLAVTDWERAAFRGPVRTVTENEADYTFDKARNAYVKRPTVTNRTSRYNRDGLVEEDTIFENGIENRNVLYEYSDDGLIRRTIRTDSQGRRKSYESSTDEDAVTAIGYRAYFDDAGVFGTKGDPNYEEYKYDTAGHPVELTIHGIKELRKFDSLGRQIELLRYKQDKLYSATHSTYEDNEHGDWIKRHDRVWFAKYPDLGFNPEAELHREITYYDEGGRK
jgi:serine protease Do